MQLKWMNKRVSETKSKGREEEKKKILFNKSLNGELKMNAHINAFRLSSC